ncbi:MAG: hypothetical protein KGL53_12010 [Elusimicrobia bacterium]|nr:hypothetical protein [Elusimicrobiota bacterium]
MDPRRFEELPECPRGLLRLAAQDMTVDELVDAAHGSSPGVVSALEGVLSHAGRSLLQDFKARPWNRGAADTARARAKLLRHLAFYETSFFGRMVAVLLRLTEKLGYPNKVRVSSLRCRFWRLKDGWEAPTAGA